jgi:hypothetical protein
VRLQAITRDPHGAVHSATITTTSGPGDTLAFDFNGSISYTHEGPDATIQLQLVSLTPGTTPETFTSQLQVRRGDVITIRPQNWRHLRTTRVRVSIRHLHGGLLRLLLRNQLSRGTRIAIVTVDASDAGSQRQLTITTRIRRVPRGVVGYVVWKVTGAGKATIRHVHTLAPHNVRVGESTYRWLYAAPGRANYSLTGQLVIMSGRGVPISVTAQKTMKFH